VYEAVIVTLVILNLQIPNSPKAKASTQTKGPEILVLAPFTGIPKIIFQDVKRGHTVEQDLLVQNPTNNNIQVSHHI